MLEETKAESDDFFAQQAKPKPMQLIKKKDPSPVHVATSIASKYGKAI